MKSIFISFVILGLVCFFGTAAMQIASQNQEKRSDMEYECLKIKSYRHWDLYLHENQYYDIKRESPRF
jgi:hypothetical protein